MEVRTTLVDDAEFGDKTKYYYDQMAALGYDWETVAGFDKAAGYYERLFEEWEDERKDRVKAKASDEDLAKLGARLNSTWWVFTTLWCVAFVAPAFVEWQHANVLFLKAVFDREIASRWREARTESRWSVCAAIAVATFWCADAEARAVSAFVCFVAARLWRETHLAQAARIDRAMRDASRRLSRAGSEFVEIMQTPSRFLAGTAKRRR